MARIEFTMSESFRSEMNSKTPSFKDWTYHHVLPVRYYYTAAHLMILAWKTRGYVEKKQTALQSAIKGMCNDNQNRKKILGLFAKVDETDQTSVREIAKLCASPNFGGFAGPWPGQRCDEPKELPEPVRPRSGDPGWWGILSLLREVVNCFLDKGTQGGAKLELNLADDLFDELVEQILQCTATLGELYDEILQFNPTDWQFCPTGDRNDGGPWRMSPEALKTGVPLDGDLPKLKLRSDGLYGGIYTSDSKATTQPYSTAPLLVRVHAKKNKLAPKAL